MKRLVGIDLNGWNDFAARSWLEVPGEEAVENRTQVVHGGVGGVVVRMQEADQDNRFVGGIQAMRAPHGLGGGWGRIGEKSRRVTVLRLLADPKKYKSELASALSAMANIRRATTVLAIPDLPTSDEDTQDALLNCLQELRPGRRLLVWRSVLAVLAALDRLENVCWREDQRVGVIGHASRGFAVQTLTLRKDGKFAPERVRTGRMVDCRLGLEHLLKQARETLKSRCTDPERTGHVEASNLAWSLALGYNCNSVPLRLWSGSWEIIDPPDEVLPRFVDVPDEMKAAFEECDTVLFESPSNGEFRAAVANILCRALGREVIVLETDAVARGALEAARCLSENEAIYYDFLPQVSTIVQDIDGAKNYDLIPPGTLLPAGQPYRSKRPARLGLVAGMEEVKVYLKKETIENPRLANLSLAVPTGSSESVNLHIEQTPAAGRARLTLVSSAFSGPLIVDWDHANVLDQDWNEVIESLMPERPTVPNRMVLPCGTDNWFPPQNRKGLDDLLRREESALQPDWRELANQMSRRPFGRYAVSTNGDYPDGLPAESRDRLEHAVRRAEQDVRDRLNGGGTSNNHSLRFLTWQFRNCPEWVIAELLDALSDGAGRHVFVRDSRSRTLMLQGLGRITRSGSDQRRVFDRLFSIPKCRWKKDQMACAAFLLSRTDTAPRLLERHEAEFIASVAERKVREAVGNKFTTRYSYGPYLLVGLLRWRLKDPWSFVAGRDPVADRLLSATRLLVQDLETRMEGNDPLKHSHKVLQEVCEELEGKGSNPNILVDLEAITRGSSE